MFSYKIKLIVISFSFSYATGNGCKESNEVLETENSISPAIIFSEEVAQVPCSTTVITSTPLHVNKANCSMFSLTPNISQIPDSSITEYEIGHDASGSIESSNVCRNETGDSSFLPDLLTESEDCMQQPSFPSGRVICDIGYVIAQARKLEEYNLICNFNGKLIYKDKLTCGLVRTYTFVCNKVLCGHKEILVTDRKQGCLNQLAVLGALSTGSGFRQEEQKFSIMNITYMSPNTYAASEKAAGDIIDAYSREKVIDAVNEEKTLAEQRRDIDSDGFYNICAVVNGPMVMVITHQAELLS